MIDRIEWQERGCVEDRHEPFFVIAQRVFAVWTFYERDMWEVCWHKAPSTRKFVARLRQELENLQKEVNKV